MLALLASYPKSGNTWLRALFSNYLSETNAPVDINTLMGRSILSLRARIDEEMGIDSSNMTDQELDNWRPDFCRQVAQQLDALTLIKVHDAYTNSSHGDPIFPADAVSKIIYAVRNPLQVAISYSHHEARDVDWAIERLNNEDTSVYSDGQYLQQLRQQLLSWSSHVASWLDQQDTNVHLVRYEDLLVDPENEFSKILDFLEIPIDYTRLADAVSSSQLSDLQQQEKKLGFFEKNEASGSFFRKGEADEWKSVLSTEQVERIVGAHQIMMQRLGYL